MKHLTILLTVTFLFSVAAADGSTPSPEMERSVLYRANGVLATTKDKQRSYCTSLGGDLAVDFTSAAHAAVTTEMRALKPTGEYFTYLGGSTTAASACPDPALSQSSLACVWSWETAVFTGANALVFYRGNFHPPNAASPGGLAGAGPLSGLPQYWGSSSGVQSFPGDRRERHVILGSWGGYDGAWVDSGDGGRVPYPTADRLQPFVALCRVEAVTSSAPSIPPDGNSGGITAPDAGRGGDNGGLSRSSLTGIIVGCVVGGLAIIGLIVLIVVCYCCGKCSSKDKQEVKQQDTVRSRSNTSAALVAARPGDNAGRKLSRAGIDCSRGSSASGRSGRLARKLSDSSADSAVLEEDSVVSVGVRPVTLSRSRPQSDRPRTVSIVLVNPLSSPPSQRDAPPSDSQSRTSSQSHRPPRRSLTDIDENGPLRIVSVEALRESLSSGSGSSHSSVESSQRRASATRDGRYPSIPGGTYNALRGSRWLDMLNRPGDGSSESASPLLPSPRPQPQPCKSAGGLSPPPPPAAPPVPTPRHVSDPAPVPAASVPQMWGPTSSRGRGRSETRKPSSRGASAPLRDSPPVPTDLSGHSPQTPSYRGGCGGGPRGREYTSSMHTSGADGTPSGHHAGDLTAMGSPIALDADDSDPAAWALIAQLQAPRAGSAGDGSSPRSASHPAWAGGYSSLATAAADAIDGACDGSGSSPFGPRDGSDLPEPFPYGNDSSAVTARPTPSTGYTSALLQALSAVEGSAMANATQQSLSSMPLYPHGGDGVGGGAILDETAPGEGRPPSRAHGRGQDLYEHAMRVMLAKQQWVSLEKARQGLLEEAKLARDCPFQPRVSAYAASIRRPSHLQPQRRAHSEVLRRRQWAAKKRREAVEREMAACTFRPLTLRAARAEPAANGAGDNREGGGAARSHSQVFSDLYRDAEARQYFAEQVRPQVVDVMERHVTGAAPAAPVLTEQEVRQVVERLFAKGAAVATASNDACRGKGEGAVGEHNAPPFHPALSKETQRMVAEKVRRGERDPDVVNDIYGRRDAAALEQQLEAAQREAEDRRARQEAAAQREASRAALDLERFRAFLAAKYRALARHAWSWQPHERSVFRPNGPHSVVDLARAALDVLSPAEAEELLAALEGCGVARVTQAEFIFVVLHHVTRSGHGAANAAVEGDADDGGGGHSPPNNWRQSALFLQPPPPAKPAGGEGRAGSSSGSVGHQRIADPLSLPPRALPPVTREAADPAAVERVRLKREERMLAWREEARRRAEEAEFGDPDYKPEPRRLIPYECRPDVQVPTRMNRAAALRRAHNEDLARRGLIEGGGEMWALIEAAGAGDATAEPTARSLFPASVVPTPTPAPAHVKARAKSTNGVKGSAQLKAITPGPAPVTSYAARTGPHASPRPLVVTKENTPAPAPAPTPNAGPAAPPASSRSESSAKRLELPPQPQVQPPAPARRASPPVCEPSTVTAVDRSLRGTIAEYAAFGGKDALIELGRDLMLRQLQEYEAKRAAKARR